jgi:hypothetical protein
MRIPLREVFAERGLELVEQAQETLRLAEEAFDQGDRGEGLKLLSWARQHLRDAHDDMTGDSGARYLRDGHEQRLRARIEQRRQAGR